MVNLRSTRGIFGALPGDSLNFSCPLGEASHLDRGYESAVLHL